MIKIFPIIILPSIFIIIFLNVKNLTQFEQKNIEIVNSKVNENENVVTNVKSPLNNKENISKQTELNDINAVSNDRVVKDYDKDIVIKKNIEVSDTNIDKKKERNIPIIVKEDNSEKKELANQKISKGSNQIKSIQIQFGAFSKLKNAEKHKKFLSEKISNKFSDFDQKLKIAEDNKLYKIIYKSDSLKTAKKVCKFSKSLKIGCLILKKWVTAEFVYI